MNHRVNSFFFRNWILILGMMQLVGCASFKLWTGMIEFKKPTIAYESCALENLTTSGAKFRTTVSVKNENSYDINIEYLRYDFYIEDEKAGQGQVDKIETLKSKSTTSVDLPIQLDYQTILLKGLAFQTNQVSGDGKKSFLTIKGEGKFTGEFGSVEREFEKSLTQAELKELLRKKVE